MLSQSPDFSRPSKAYLHSVGKNNHQFMYNWAPINPPSVELGSKGLRPPRFSPISRPPAHEQVGHQQMVSLFVISGPCSQDKPTHIESDIPTLDHFSPWSLLPLSSLQSHAGDVWKNSMCLPVIFLPKLLCFSSYLL